MRTLLTILLLSPQFIQAQEEIEPQMNQEEFALHVVKSIIDRDCETYYASIDDSVVLYLGVEDTIIAKNDFEGKLKMLCQLSVKSDSIDYEYYLENFEQRYFSAESLANEEFYGHGEIISTLGSLKFYDIKPDDIFFVGSIHKTANSLDYILDDAFKFIFRKIDDEYKIVLMTN